MSSLRGPLRGVQFPWQRGSHSPHTTRGRVTTGEGLGGVAGVRRGLGEAGMRGGRRRRQRRDEEQRLFILLNPLSSS